MKLNFNKIITESVIDELKIDKVDKGILKLMNSYIKNIDNEYEVISGLIKISEHISYYDYDKLYSLYKFYKKYSKILFGELTEYENSTSLNYSKDNTVIMGMLFNYYWDNYGGKTFFIDGLEWEYTLPMGSVEESIIEDAESIEIRLLGDETIPIVSIFVSLLEGNRGIGFDMISMDDGLAAYNAKYIKNKGTYEEILDTGYILGLKRPKDLKTNTLKEYFEELVDYIQMDIIGENQWIIEHYIEWASNNQPPR
jgi:hypothetical protein